MFIELCWHETTELNSKNPHVSEDGNQSFIQIIAYDLLGNLHKNVMSNSRPLNIPAIIRNQEMHYKKHANEDGDRGG